MFSQLLMITLFHTLLSRVNAYAWEGSGEDAESDEDLASDEYFSSFLGCQKKYPQYTRLYYYPPGYRNEMIQKTTNIYVVCERISLTKDNPLPVYSDLQNITYIIFLKSNIPLVPVGVFNKFIGLKQLYLNDSSVGTIHPGAFTGLTNLEEIYLQHNNLSKISQGIFNSLAKLKTLNLSYNKIVLVEEHAFLGISRLKYLYLSNNNIENVTPGTFDVVNYSGYIDLSHNKLFHISENVFHNMISLDLSYNNLTVANFTVLPQTLLTLKLSNNLISVVDNLTPFTSITTLDLSQNHISNIVHIPTRVNSLNLGGNRISNLSEFLFNNSNNLYDLNLSRNQITNISADTFIGLSKLKSLYLQNNGLNKIPIGSFRMLDSLNILNMSSNMIDELDFGTFSGLSHLENLDVSNNNLSHLQEGCFHPLTDLKILNLGNNFLTNLNPVELLKYAKYLQKVNLGNNPWDCKLLSDILVNFNKSGVQVVKGHTDKSRHLHGNACFKHKHKNHSLQNGSSLTEEQKILHGFFNEDFLNSEFYRFFKHFKPSNFNHTYLDNMLKKYFEEGFQNTTFYKYFSQNNFSSDLDKALSKVSEKLHSIGKAIENSSLDYADFHIIHKNFLSLFEGEFKNTSLYKYFDKEFLKSGFFKYFDKTLYNRIDSNLMKLHEYFDNDFKNSTFYRFFEENQHYSNPNITNAARYIDNSEQTSMLSKMSELINILKDQETEVQVAKTYNFVFMAITVVILIGITLLLVFKHIKKHFKQNTISYKSSDSRTHFSEAEMELV